MVSMSSIAAWIIWRIGISLPERYQFRYAMGARSMWQRAKRYGFL
jgi:hypothetical protein